MVGFFISVQMKYAISFKQNNHKLLPFKTTKRAFLIIIFVFLFELFLFPTTTVLANTTENNKQGNTDQENILPEMPEIPEITEEEPKIIENNLPDTEEWRTIRSGYYTITAYNSEVGQCDNTPCITANGFNLCEHGIEDSVATNALPFGTKIRIPELFGDKVFVVRDRMNKRYTNRFDIWMKNKIDAKKFGLRVAKIEILEP